jgi:hypothetical protein
MAALRVTMEGDEVWDARRIHARLAAVREADPGFARFGASQHRYRLGPVLPEADVRAFEVRHGVILPAAYRSFLLHVGDGGAGPHYGLLRLEGTDRPDPDPEERLQRRFLATPFPHTQAWNPPGPVHAGGGMTEEGYFHSRWVSGSMIIAEYGCASFHRLVVTGPARGQVWFDDRASFGGLAPEACFRAWYEQWLNSLDPAKET